MEDALIIAIGWIGAVVIGYLAAGVRLGEVLAELNFVKSNVMSGKAALGGAARVANEEEMETALMEAAGIMQNSEIQDKPKALAALAMKYPRVALRLAKKGFKIG